MNRRLLLNLVMLLGVGLLSWVALQKPGQPPAETPAALTNLDGQQIKRLIITQGTTPDALEIERRGDSWWLLGEPEIPADTSQIETLLRVLSTHPARSYAAADLDLKQLDLVPAQTQVRFDDLEIKFGGTEPLEGLRYVEVGDRVHLIRDSYQNILQGKRAQLASRRLLPVDAAIIAITLPDLHLTKQDDGGWTLDPEPENLSADAAQKLVQHWMTTSALWVRDYQPADAGKSVRIGLANGDTIEFELREDDRGDVTLARPALGLQYNLPAFSAKRLLELERNAADTVDATISDQP